MERIQKNHLYFLRHCTTENNEQGLISGRLDNHIKSMESVDYTELKYTDDMVILSSPSMRCRETANKLCSSLSVIVPIMYLDQLLERSMGSFEGKKRDEVAEEFPEYFINNKFIYYLTPPQGESYKEMCIRAEEFLDEILTKKIESNNVLICSHNQLLKILYFRLLDVSVEEYWYKYNFQNGKVYKIW